MAGKSKPKIVFDTSVTDLEGEAAQSVLSLLHTRASYFAVLLEVGAPKVIVQNEARCLFNSLFACFGQEVLFTDLKLLLDKQSHTEEGEEGGEKEKEES